MARHRTSLAMREMLQDDWDPWVHLDEELLGSGPPALAPAVRCGRSPYALRDEGDAASELDLGQQFLLHVLGGSELPRLRVAHDFDGLDDAEW